MTPNGGSSVKEYNSILLEQFNEGVIELCTENHSQNSYYMPHKPVIRDDKTTTKMSIVYDASSKCIDSLSISLNPKKTFEILNSSLYVDDLFSRKNDVSKEAVDILKEGGMKLRKVESNS